MQTGSSLNDGQETELKYNRENQDIHSVIAVQTVMYGCLEKWVSPYS